MITYRKLFALMKEQGKNTSHIRKENIIGQETLRKLKIGTGVLEEYDYTIPGAKDENNKPIKEKRTRETSIDTKAIESLCKWLNCQPSDIMEETIHTATIPKDISAIFLISPITPPIPPAPIKLLTNVLVAVERA